MTKPAPLWASTHVVIVPSVPQLTVWKLTRVLGGNGLTVSTTLENGAAALANVGTPPMPPLTRFAPPGAAGIGPLQP